MPQLVASSKGWEMPNNSQPSTVDQSATVQVQTESGAVYRAIHVSRTVKTYPIQEHELDSLDDLGRNSTLWTSIGWGALAFLANCVWSSVQSPSLPSMGQAAFMLLLLAVGIVALIVGSRYAKRRKSRLAKIMEECES